jgi:hypothetical protein
MKAHRMEVTIPEDHQVELRLPEDFPAGPAEIIVLADSPDAKASGGAQKQMLQALQKLRTIQWTPEEQQIFEEFDEFRRQHPIDFTSLPEDER